MVDRDHQVNRCKYWITDEPEVCSYWDDTLTECTFEGIKDDGTILKSSRYPYCNLIGTAIECTHYDGDGATTEARCVLPDPYRHVCNRATGKKWVWMRTPPKYGEEGEMEEAADWTFDHIDGYNEGFCDESGTATTCSGYNPGNMNFGRLKPEPLPANLQAALDEPWTGYKTAAELGYRLPLAYDIWNARAELSRCYWWANDQLSFSIDSDMGFINPMDFHCTNPDEITNQFGEHRLGANGRYIPPCNGAHDECPRYTGICWEYCIVDKMQEGDKILAEQILELRYYLKREKWNYTDYVKSFIDPHIFAWTGPEGLHYVFTADGDLDFENTMIDTIETYQTDFNHLDIEYRKTPISQGQPSQDGKTSFPTLVKKIKSLYLTPIIRNKFDTRGGINLFEVNDMEHKDILIIGDTFWYDSISYGINLNDPELIHVIPDIENLLNHDGMADIEAALGAEGFEEYYEKLDEFLNNLKNYVPGKMIATEIGATECMFYISMPTFFGVNEIMVINEGSGRWEFDKITILKTLHMGFVRQRSFVVGAAEDNDKGVVDRLPWYEKDFYTRQNDDGAIEFDLRYVGTSILNDDIDSSGEHVYIYNDHFNDVISANPLSADLSTLCHQSYRLYKILAISSSILSIENAVFFGNYGCVLLTIPDEELKLSNVHADWEIDGSIRLSMSETETTEMEIFEKGTARLELNQIILRPKDISTFFSFCGDMTILVPDIYVYEKRSFNQLPDDDEYEEIEPSIGEDDSIAYTSEQIELDTNEDGFFELTKFNNEDLFISIVYRGENGRIRGVTRTKLVTWVRQPFCKDVEIFYDWKSSYSQVKLLPEMDCWMALAGSKSLGETAHSYSPPCGDHDLPSFNPAAPMWYPYNSCPPDVRYNIITQFTEFDIKVIEQFSGKYGSHGVFDLRMMGPPNNIARTCDVHVQPWSCACDWSFCNEAKKSGNVFTGWGRYRGGLTGESISKCLANDGTMPKFGNVHRNFLRSYRSMDNIYYYKVTGSSFGRTYKWVPMYEMYSESNISANATGYPFDLYTRDYSSPFVHQLGLMRAISFEGININETVDIENRYRFEEVMKVHSSLVGLQYPFPRNLYLIGLLQKPLISWFTFKDYPEDSTKSIQWVWRELWRDLERQSILLSDVFSGDEVDTTLIEYNPPYSYNGRLEGRHAFLSINHPDYLNSIELEENRAVCNEGEHEIKVVPSARDEHNQDVYFLVMLDNGPFRIFDLNGNWVTEVPENVSFGDAYDDDIELFIKTYNSSSGQYWYSQVTLYESGTPTAETPEEAIEQAEEDGRMVITDDFIGEEIVTYYQRGLNVILLPNAFNSLPFKIIPYIGLMDFQVTYPPLEGPYSDMIPSEWYSFGVITPYMLFEDIQSETDIIFDFTPIPGSSKNIIYKVRVVYEVGAVPDEEYDEEDTPTAWLGELGHIPEVDVYIGDSLVKLTQVYNERNMILSTKDSGSPNMHEVEYDLGFAIENLNDPYRFLKMSLRLKPTSSEIEEAEIEGYNSECSHFVKIIAIHIYTVRPVEATEVIQTKERMYNVSYGDHGDFPPHGTDDTGSLLYPISGDRSTVYQHDNRSGVIGMPNSDGAVNSMNKCRGRVMHECQADKTSTGGRGVYDLEGKQKEVHDSIAIDSGSTIGEFQSILPIDFMRRLQELNIPIPGTYSIEHAVGGQGVPFMNNLVLPLAQVLQKATYSPCGHHFFHDASTMDGEVRVCGRLWARNYRSDVFDYGFANVCTGDAYATQTQMDEAHTKKALGVITANPMLLKQVDSIRHSKMDVSTNTTEETTTRAVPEGIVPFTN